MYHSIFVGIANGAGKKSCEGRHMRTKSPEMFGSAHKYEMNEQADKLSGKYLGLFFLDISFKISPHPSMISYTTAL